MAGFNHRIDVKDVSYERQRYLLDMLASKTGKLGMYNSIKGFRINGYWGGDIGEDPYWYPKDIKSGHACCYSKKCLNIPAYRCLYDYVTGRQGRITDRRTFMCIEHTKGFAKKYHLILPRTKQEQLQLDILDKRPEWGK